MASWLRLVAADPACGGGDARPVVAVADRLGVVSRIALSADAWDTRLQRVMTIDHRVGWTGASESHTELLGGDSSHLDLLVISPTPPRFWPTSLAMAAGQDVSPNQRGGVLATYAPIAPRRVPRGERSLNGSAVGRPTADVSGNWPSPVRRGAAAAPASP
jgi:hypothetical protein